VAPGPYRPYRVGALGSIGCAPQPGFEFLVCSRLSLATLHGSTLDKAKLGQFSAYTGNILPAYRGLRECDTHCSFRLRGYPCPRNQPWHHLGLELALQFEDERDSHGPIWISASISRLRDRVFTLASLFFCHWRTWRHGVGRENTFAGLAI